jgi:probable rRNA maturation factor
MSSDGGSIFFRSIPGHLRLNADEKRTLKHFASSLSAEVGEGRTFSCLITDDKALHKLNLQFLQHDYPTDVLSFPAGSDSDELGELAISVERAEAQAAGFGHTLLDELRILMLHGVLHLSGMDHERDKGEMAAAERRLRKLFQLPQTLIMRVRT